MKLTRLLHTLGISACGVSEEIEIGGIRVDSREVRVGDLFVALTGAHADGHDYLEAAACAGAAAALVDRDLAFPPLPVFRVSSTVDSLREAAIAFYGDPSARLRVTGITGTNGKTTITYLLEGILRAAGKVPAVIGTIDYRIGEKVLRKGLTTPFPHDLQAVMSEALAEGASDLLMEVSSHSAAQGRIGGVRFDLGIFTNLTRDHLDFHGDMESYFRAKARFFHEYLPFGGKETEIALNGDDPYGERLSREFPSALTFGLSHERGVFPLELEMSLEGCRMTLSTPGGPLPLRSRLVGAHNVSNIMAAVSGALLLHIPLEAIVSGIESVRLIPGRLEPVKNERGLRIFVDYAHTPDGMDRVLTTLRLLTDARLITVFGCGGNRDRGKRPEMGRIAALRSDVVVVTSDNPRGEEPDAIIAEILPGLASGGFIEASGTAECDKGFYLAINNREKAIRAALSLANERDMVVIVGKGHENVQIIGDRSLPFDDREVVCDVLAQGG
ncbi:MAG: UDP-N-acetylmuramoyl-L-alanyl-D-glutamate--2,6-diaminopimelate ligase [Syntrophorhabdaceae bacterium]|nr:UDP-N-acetylmuramoyl-L-alanyl-D-glutamate--2,6-diaminopimelate ligase [Syntrophorhabdaceae bacterium]